MTKTLKVFIMVALVAMVGGAFAVAAHAQAVKGPSGPNVYTVINNDVYLHFNGQFNTGTVFANNHVVNTLNTGSYGDGGAYFTNTQADVVVGRGSKCIFLADAGGTSGSGPGDIASFNYPTLISNYTSNFGGNGYGHGISIANVGSVLLVGGLRTTFSKPTGSAPAAS